MGKCRRVQTCGLGQGQILTGLWGTGAAEHALGPWVTAVASEQVCGGHSPGISAGLGLGLVSPIGDWVRRVSVAWARGHFVIRVRGCEGKYGLTLPYPTGAL